MSDQNFQTLQTLIEHPRDLTPEDRAAQKAWERPRQEARIAKASALAELRIVVPAQIMVASAAVEAAFQYGDPIMLDAAQEECLRLIELIRRAKRIG